MSRLWGANLVMSSTAFASSSCRVASKGSRLRPETTSWTSTARLQSLVELSEAYARAAGKADNSSSQLTGAATRGKSGAGAAASACRPGPPAAWSAATAAATASVWTPGAGAGASTEGCEAATVALAAAELRAAVAFSAGIRSIKARRRGEEAASRCSSGAHGAIYASGRFGACAGSAAVASPSLFAGLGAIPVNANPARHWGFQPTRSSAPALVLATLGRRHVLLNTLRKKCCKKQKK